jgi:hypothetical protein
MESEYMLKRRGLKNGTREPDPKKAPVPIAKESAKTAAKKAGEKKARGDQDTFKEAWFKARRKEMVGVCQHCGGKSCKDSDEYFRFSIAHLLPKNLFESVALHPSNWIELCHFGNSCHANMDNKILDLMDMNCFNDIIEKFLVIYPDIDKAERKYIPDILIQYLKDNSAIDSRAK